MKTYRNEEIAKAPSGYYWCQEEEFESHPLMIRITQDGDDTDIEYFHSYFCSLDNKDFELGTMSITGPIPVPESSIWEAQLPESSIWEAQLHAWPDSVKLTHALAYFLLKEHPQLLAQMEFCLKQYADGVFYLCGKKGNGYEHMGYRYGVDASKYMSGFIKPSLWSMS